METIIPEWVDVAIKVTLGVVSFLAGLLVVRYRSMYNELRTTQSKYQLTLEANKDAMGKLSTSIDLLNERLQFINKGHEDIREHVDEHEKRIRKNEIDVAQMKEIIK